MENIDRFEVTPIEKETIKLRLLLTISYFNDRVFPKADYMDNILNECDKEIKKDEIVSNDDRKWWKALLSIEIIEIQYRMLLMFITLICQMYEQFLLDIIIKKLEFERGIYFNKVQEIYNEYGFDFKNMKSWDKINELRLLVNVIKHADGNSRNELQNIIPDLFYDSPSDTINNTINDMKLNITSKDFFEYCSKIIEFINDMPGCFEKE